MASIPLFPLKSVLFPLGRLPLQIFEPRYLDLVKSCLKNGRPFGVVPLKSGQEIGPPGDVYPIGVTADIVDWNQLSNGLLGITIVGRDVFSIQRTSINDNNLLLGDVEFLELEASEQVPEPLAHLKALLQNLLDHSVVQKMDMVCDFNNASDVAWLLGYLLPFSRAKKVELLTIPQAVARLEKIVEMLDDMTQQLNK